MKVLVVEDGFEHSDALARFLPPSYRWTRAGSGPEALEMLSGEAFDAVFLDMRFDRVPESELLGDVAEVADRFNGDPVRAREFLEDHQGHYVLAAIREAGHRMRVVLSYDFEEEPRRWAHLVERYSPVDFHRDHEGPTEVARRLEGTLASE